MTFELTNLTSIYVTTGSSCTLPARNNVNEMSIWLSKIYLMFSVELFKCSVWNYFSEQFFLSIWNKFSITRNGNICGLFKLQVVWKSGIYNNTVLVPLPVLEYEVPIIYFLPEEVFWRWYMTIWSIWQSAIYVCVREFIVKWCIFDNWRIVWWWK